MAWDEIGFTVNLIRSDLLPAEGTVLDPLAFEQLAPEFSGGKLTGILQSQDGSVKLDLDNSSLLFKKGIQEIAIGKLSDGSFGFQMINENGKKILSLNELEKFIGLDSNFKILNIENNNIIIDNNGLVSGTSFESNFVTATGAQATTSDSFVDLAVPQLPILIKGDKDIKTLVFGSLTVTNTAQVAEAMLTLENNVNVAQTFTYATGTVGSSVKGTGTFISIINLSPGNHTLKFRFRSVVNGSSVNVADITRYIGYLILGK